ncbi:MAG: hypothetical protein ABSE70_06330 [Candidatus Limnocylindrales bacterium]
MKGTRGSALVIALICAAVAASACTSALASPSGSGRSPASPSVASPEATATPTFGDCCAPPTSRPYALVTARPNRDTQPGPSASTRPTASPTAADASSQDGAGYFDQTVPAGGSSSIPIDFEGSTWGSLTGYAKPAGLTVTLRGKSLKVDKVPGATGDVWGFGDSGDNPVNGDLVVKNTTASPVEVAGFVMILTRRHLIVEPSIRYPRKGQEITFDVSLTQATDADDLTASIVGSDGQATPVGVTKVGTGHWTGRATFSEVGEKNIRVITTGTHIRVGMGYVIVAAGDVTVSSSFTEDVEDTDHDGLIDELVLTPTITVPEAGKYMANATLVDQSGAQVTTDLDGEIDLVSGAQPLKLRFGGQYIYESGRWGPYTLHVTIVHNPTTAMAIELDDAVLGQTAAYDYMQFQHDRIAVDPKSLKSTAVDTNGDGLYDELDITGTVTVESAGLYAINSSLYADNPWGDVAGAYATVPLAAGPNSFKLVYKGSDIAKAGRDGPYQVPSLVVYLQSVDPMGYQPSESVDYSTAAYKASQFGR